MRLYTLNLNNFQGIRSLTLAPHGANVSVYGDNGTGKTTIFNAITWLLFGRAGEDIKGYTPKTRTADGEAHNLEHSAEGCFLTDDGGKISLKKVFREVYKKKNGSAESEFSGHTTDFYLDGVPVKEKEYTDRLSGLFGNAPDLARILTVPGYFPASLNWETRRQRLIEICGDVSEAQLIHDNPDFSELRDILSINGTDRMYTVSDYLKIASAKKTEINKALLTIPARIDEAHKAIPDVSEVNAVSIKERIARIDECVQDLNRRKSALKSDGAVEIRAALRDKKTQMEQARSEYIKALNDEQEKRSNDLIKAQTRCRDLIRDLSRYDNEKRVAESEKRTLEALRAELIAEYNKVSAQTFNEADTVCPTCGQAMPAEKINALREEFNLKKSLTLSAINERGKTEASKEMIAKLDNVIKQREKDLADIKELYDSARDTVTKLSSSLPDTTPFEKSEDGTRFAKEISDIEAQLREAEKDSDAVVSGIEKEIADLYVSRSTEQEKLSGLETMRHQTKRIQELEAEEKRLGAEFAETERRIYLCEQLIRAKISSLDENINSKFKNVKFRLFSEQINGGVKEECEAMIPAPGGQMVPYSFANNAAKINAGLEIIDVISKHYGVSLPVVVDNAESVTALASIGAQTIRLVVSESDKELRYEYQ